VLTRFKQRERLCDIKECFHKILIHYLIKNQCFDFVKIFFNLKMIMTKTIDNEKYLHPSRKIVLKKQLSKEQKLKKL
jgi:hypothetical protein